MDLLSLLVEKNTIDVETSKKIKAHAAEHGFSIEQAALEHDIADTVIREMLGAYYDLPTRVIKETDIIDQKILSYIPEESAKHYKCIPLAVVDNVLEVGVVDPDNLALKDALNFITAKHQIPYRLFVILERDHIYGLKSYESLTGEVDEVLDLLESDLEPSMSDASEEERIEHIKEDAPVTKIVATILRYAVDGSASDIHIEPTESRVVVRFRVDGVLATSLQLPRKVHLAVVARVKILSSLRLDEKRKPQDGRFSATIDGRKIDFRVSVLPTNHGEKVVMRILDTEGGVRTLEGTGVSPKNVELIRDAIKQPFGIILISGPTGSGKSTTLYSMLSEVDRERKNVLSLEDPVEYNITGVSQSQVRPEIGYTFAAGLRAALRQDPDIIMVGEIRDKETAQLAIQAALTGHLVLSTIHTNNSIGVIPRLIDMGVDPYLIAPTLQLAIAQRLVKRICPNSGKQVPVEGSIKMMIEEEFKDLPEQYRSHVPTSDHVLYAEPTKECTDGTKGRIAVMEAVVIDDDIERLILQGGTEEQIYQAARKKGFITMKEDAITKALRHEIPFEEVSTLGGAMLVSDKAEEGAEQLPVDNHETAAA
ncbi:MAG: GspE/PulE family protein [Candidatus Pacebacteria bacterium]|nr:GspE/PulE family protein [Candidatus Paceibacterota bacterium]